MTHDLTWKAMDSNTDEAALLRLRVQLVSYWWLEAGVAREDSDDVPTEYVAESSTMCCFGVMIGLEGEAGIVRGVDMQRGAGTARWGLRSSGGRYVTVATDVGEPFLERDERTDEEEEWWMRVGGLAGGGPGVTFSAHAVMLA